MEPSLMAKKLKLIGPEVVVTVAGVAAAEDSVEAAGVVEVSEVDMAVAVMVDIHVVETVMVDTEEAVEVDLEEVAVADSEEDVGVVEAVEAVTTAIKMVISPANAQNNAKNGIKYPEAPRSLFLNLKSKEVLMIIRGLSDFNKKNLLQIIPHPSVNYTMAYPLLDQMYFVS